LQNSQRAEVQVSTRVDPKLVLTSTLLQMTQVELEQAVEAELAENPALEVMEQEQEPLDEDTIADQLLLRAGARYSFAEDTVPTKPYDPDDSQDWTDFVVAPVSLADHLRAQLLPMLPERLHALGANVVDAVNDRGYLDMQVEELALSFDATMEDVEEVLEKLQQCEPAGVGARDLRECLLIQLRQMPSEPVRDLALHMVADCWEEFTKQRYSRIGRRYGARPFVVQAAASMVAHLNPFPGEAFRAEWDHFSPSPAPSVTPDVVIRRTDNGYEVEIRGFDPSALTINERYRRLHQQRDRLSSDERSHVVQYVDRAQNFIASIQQRRRTVRRIVDYLLQTQSGFIATGSYRFLRPLTRMQLAREIGVHESTVSRATMGKFVQLPSQEVVPFEVFFKPALRVQKAIEEILRHENPGCPLSDERISKMLKEQGIEVARRTINKYRERLNILSSRRRRA